MQWNQKVKIVWQLLTFLLFPTIQRHPLGLNSNVAASKSLANISNGVHPIIIQFPTLRQNREFCVVGVVRDVCTLNKMQLI
jgi:hypothetical protein